MAASQTSPRTLRIGLWQEPDNINAYLTWMATGVWLGSLVLEPLVRPDAHGTFHPVLAERVPTLENGDIAPDGLTVTYHLRRDVVWSDGEPFTSADVRATWETLANPAHQVISREGFEWIQAIECPDPHTAVLRFSQAFPPFRVLFLCVYPAHRMRHMTDFINDPFHRAPLGTGPYLLEAWEPHERLTFVANPRYHGTRPYFKRLEFVCVPDRSGVASLVLEGALDAGISLSIGDVPRLERAERLHVMVTPTTVTERVVFNQRHPALADVRVRRALELATDKREIVRDVLGGRAEVAVTELDGTTWANPDLRPPAFAPDEAEELLDAAGWTRGANGMREKDGQPLTLTLCIPTGDTQREAVARRLAAGFAAVGVDLRTQSHRSDTLFGNAANGGVLVRGDFDLALRARGMWGDPDPNMSICYQSRWIPSAENQGMGANFGGYQNTVVDEALEEAQNTMDEARRHELYYLAQRHIQDDVPVMYLFRHPNVDVARAEIRGFDQLPYVNVWGSIWNAHEWTEANQ